MKERLKNVVKWFLITLGVLFLAQILILAGAVAGASKFAHADRGIVINSKDRIKKIQPIIDYAEDFKKKNQKYPEKIENVEIKKDIEYEYSTSDNATCYNIKAKSKKDNVVQEYKRCSAKDDNSSSDLESYSEYSVEK